MENSNFKAQFLDYQIINGVVFYTISMIDPQSIKTFFLTSRYSSLLTLHESLKRKYNEQIRLPNFPPKKWFGNLKFNFLTKRKRLLEEYFNAFLTNVSLVKDPLTLQYFEMTENEKFFRKNSSLMKNSHEPLRISISRKYNVKIFFEEYESHNNSIGNELLKKSFATTGFSPLKGLEDLKKFKTGVLNIQTFLNEYNLVYFLNKFKNLNSYSFIQLLGKQELDWEIISVVDSKYLINHDTRSCNYQIMDKGKKKIYTVKLVEFIIENDHMIYHYITELFNLLYISKQIKNPYLLLVKNCFYFENEDRLCRELKKHLLIIREYCPFNLKEAIEIRKAKNMQWTIEELLTIFRKLISVFVDLERIGISHNSLNLESIFYSKGDGCYKVGCFLYSHHQKFSIDFEEEFSHFKSNSKYNSPEISEILKKENANQEDFIKIDPLKNDVYALGMIFLEMFNLSSSENECVLLDKFKILMKNERENHKPGNVIFEIINSMLVENPALRFSFKRLWETYFIQKEKEEKMIIGSEIILFNDLEIMLKQIHPQNSQFKTKIKRMNMIAHGYNRLGKQQAALEIYEEIFEQIKKAKVSLEEKKIKEIKIIRKMSLVYHEMADYKKTEHLLKIALGECEKIENQTILYTILLINLSHNCSASYDFKNANEYLEKAVELHTLNYGENSLEIADLYNDQGFVCEKMGEHEKALGLLEKALVIKKQKWSKVNIGIGKILINLGLVYQGMEKYEKSLEYFNEALIAFQTIYGKICHDIILIKNMIGGVYLLKKEYAESLKFLEEAWAFSKELSGEKSLSITDVFFNLGKCYWNTRNFEKAKVFLRNAKKLRKKILGDNHIEVAEIRNVLGCLYLELLQFEKARKNMHVALKIFKRVLGKSHLHIAELNNNYGYIHTKLNNLKKARKCHERCLNIYKIHLGKQHRYISITLNNLGSICLETGEFEEAVIHFQEAVEILRNTNQYDLNLANIYNLLGIAYCHMNQYREALEVLELSYKIYSLKLEKNNPKMLKLEKDIIKIKENMNSIISQ